MRIFLIFSLLYSFAAQAGEIQVSVAHHTLLYRDGDHTMSFPVTIGSNFLSMPALITGEKHYNTINLQTPVGRDTALLIGSNVSDRKNCLCISSEAFDVLSGVPVETVVDVEP